LHQDTGWSAPIVPPAIPSRTWPCGCGPNGSSTTVARTCETSRTLDAKLYQGSVRSQYSGSVFVASCTRSATLTVPDCRAVVPDDRVPRMSVRNDQEGTVSIADPIP